MKAIMLNLFLAVGLFLVGCSDNSSILEPDGNKSTVNQNITAEPNWLLLTGNENLSLRKSYKVTKFVEKDKDCEMKIDQKIKNELTGSEIKIKAEIKFKKGTLNEDTWITMEIDDQTGVLTFTPQMVFNKNANLKVELKGLPLGNIDPATIQFVYLAPDGTYEPVKTEKLKVEIDDKGMLKLKVEAAELPHFSRYGWAK